MSKAYFSAAKTLDGKGVELIVTGHFENIAEELDSLGYSATEDFASRRTIKCYTPNEIEAARDPLKKYMSGEREGAKVVMHV